MREWSSRRPTIKQITNGNPVVRFLFEEMERQQIHEACMSERAGFHRDTLRKWRNTHQPRITDIEACLNLLGYELKPVRVRERRND